MTKKSNKANKYSMMAGLKVAKIYCISYQNYVKLALVKEIITISETENTFRYRLNMNF